MNQDCKHYDYQVEMSIVGVDGNGGPVYDITNEQEFCHKLESGPTCDDCKHYEKRVVEETDYTNELPF